MHFFIHAQTVGHKVHRPLRRWPGQLCWRSTPIVHNALPLLLQKGKTGQEKWNGKEKKKKENKGLLAAIITASTTMLFTTNRAQSL